MPKADTQDATAASIYRLWTEQPIRYNDADMQGHVNNTVFPVYFEAGRLALNRGADSPPRDPAQGIVIAQTTIRYLKPVTWPGVVRVGTRVLEIGRSSCTLGQAAFSGDTCIALCETVTVCVDLRTGAPMPHGDTRRAYLEGFC